MSDCHCGRNFKLQNIRSENIAKTTVIIMDSQIDVGDSGQPPSEPSTSFQPVRVNLRPGDLFPPPKSDPSSRRALIDESDVGLDVFKMLRRIFKNRIDVEREWLLQHRNRSYPLYSYINLQHEGRLVEIYRDSFAEKLREINRRQAADSEQQVAQHRRRRLIDQARRGLNLCDVIRKELGSCVYNDGNGENITRNVFRKWKQQWGAKLSVSRFSLT